MNKRGEEADPRGFTLTAIIILIALGLVLFFVFTNGATLKRWFGFIPSFNETAKGAEQLGYVRFDSVDFKLQSFTGVWNNILEDKTEDKIKLNNIDYTLKDFEELYLLNNKIKSNKDYLFAHNLHLSPNTNSWKALKEKIDDAWDTEDDGLYVSIDLNLYALESNVPKSNEFFTSKSGDYIFYIIDRRTGVPKNIESASVYGMLRYGLSEGKIEFIKYAEQTLTLSGYKYYGGEGFDDFESTELVNLIKNYIDDTVGKIWTEKPIQIKDNYYCVDFRSQRYFIVDLMKPVNAEVNCLA